VSKEVINVRISILPKSLLGWWSVGLVVAYLVFGFSSEDIISPAGLPNYSMALRVTLMFALAGISIAAFVTGLISIIKRKQGSILVFVSTAIGLFLGIESVIAAVQTMMGLS
jgi:hypothetical protein